MRRIVPMLALLALVAGACSSDEGGSSEPSKVTFKTQEYGFDVPDTFAGGLVEITLDNSAGEESHEAEMIMLDAGKTLADAIAAFQSEGPPPEWAHAAGGPGPVLPGGSATYTANLEAGTYILVCHVPAPDGTPHLEKGMAAEVTVTEGTVGTLPAGDATVTLDEFSIAGTDQLKAGSQTVRVSNAGEQDHHVAVIAMAEGATVEDLAAFFGAEEPSGPPPFTGFPGLIATMAPGSDVVRTLDLEAGTSYVFACFIPDTDGAPHFAKGMVAQITAA